MEHRLARDASPARRRSTWNSRTSPRTGGAWPGRRPDGGTRPGTASAARAPGGGECHPEGPPRRGPAGRCRSPASGGGPSGGSLTTRRPPTRSRGAAHSAVAGGAPNPRAITASAVPRSSPRPTTSARPTTTRTRSSMASAATADSRNSHRRALESTSTSSRSGRATAIGRPGTPPPLPRSTTRPVTSAKASTKPAAWTRWSSAGPGPRRPSERARSSCAQEGGRDLRRRSLGEDHDSAAVILALRDGGDAVDVVHGVVDDLAVGGRHGLEGLPLAGLQHLLGDALGEPGQGLAARSR